MTTVAVFADQSYALSGSMDNTLLLWDLETGGCLASFTGDAGISCVSVTRGDLLVAGSQDGKVHILEIREQ